MMIMKTTTTTTTTTMMMMMYFRCGIGVNDADDVDDDNNYHDDDHEVMMMIMTTTTTTTMMMMMMMKTKMRTISPYTAAALQGPVYYRPEKEQDEDSVEAEDTRLPPGLTPLLLVFSTVSGQQGPTCCSTFKYGADKIQLQGPGNYGTCAISTDDKKDDKKNGDDSDKDDSDEDDSKSETGPAIGGAVGGVAAIVVLGGAVMFFRRGPSGGEE
nr:hypothetical protein BaRGS_001967 [Batillaria attramentaria]